MNIFANALAEEASPELSAVVEGLTKEEAAVAGAIAGAAIGVVIVLMLVWYVFQVIADWKIFTKAGEAGWKSLIPVYSSYIEYDICWAGLYGLIFGVASLAGSALQYISNPPQWVGTVSTVLCIVALVFHIIQSLKLAKSFGKGTGFGVCLILFGPICRLILGFGQARYIGNQG